MLKQPQPEISELLAVLPKIEWEYDDYGGKSISIWQPKLDKAISKLREVSGNCPACIMAALRQKNIPVPMVKEFNFSKECEAIWSYINSENYQKEQNENFAIY